MTINVTAWRLQLMVISRQSGDCSAAKACASLGDSSQDGLPEKFFVLKFKKKNHFSMGHNRLEGLLK